MFKCTSLISEFFPNKPTWVRGMAVNRAKNDQTMKS